MSFAQTGLIAGILALLGVIFKQSWVVGVAVLIFLVGAGFGTLFFSIPWWVTAVAVIVGIYVITNKKK